MRRSVAILLSVGVLSVWCFVGNISVRADGEDSPATAELNGDVNGDGARDMSDPVYMLKWMMRGGPAPVALARPEPINAFGRRIAGIYFGTSEPAGLSPLQQMARFNADGTFAGEFHTLEGPGSRAMTTHGIWEQTGPRELIATQVTFLVNTETDELETIVVARSIVTFDDDFGGLDGTFTTDIFLPGQDITVDDPVASFPGGMVRSNRVALAGP